MADVPVKALKKGLEVLTMLLFADAQGKGLSVKEVASRMRMPANSAHNLLKTLTACGYAEKNYAGRYAAGRVSRQIAFANFQNDGEFREQAAAVLARLWKEVNAGLVFAALDRNVWRTIIRLDARGAPVAADHENVERRFLYETATGRVLFSFSAPRRRAELLRENPEAEAAWPEYRQEWSAIRRAGYCELLRQRYRVFSMAVPVFHGRRLAGALGAFFPPRERSPEHDRYLLERLRAAAAELAGRNG